MGAVAQIRLHKSLLPALGKLLPGEKNMLSPLRLSSDREATQQELQDASLLEAGSEDAPGRLKAEHLPWLQILANPASLVDLRFSASGQFQQFSLYYSGADEPPVLLMNAGEGLLVERPADTASILDGLVQFSSDSLVASFDFQAALPYQQALALAALVDLQRRQAARAFADLAAADARAVSADEAARWIAACPDDPRWLVALIRKPSEEAPSAARLQADLNLLAERGFCEALGQGYALSPSMLPLGNRLAMADRLYTLDVARMGSGGRAAVVSITALQGGVNDFLQIEFQGDEILFTSLSPMAFLDQAAYYLEKGGAELPDLAQPAGTTEPQTPPQTPPQAALACAQCGQPLSANARFCPKCGAPVQRKCPHCGNELSPTARFCANCGAAVD
ncbi:MAG: zinc ribbon domain-containing protein [Anaerolineales bacterium]|nr:zinc ribbon domain-containing protein [Anaerolineales bacterium]